MDEQENIHQNQPNGSGNFHPDTEAEIQAPEEADLSQPTERSESPKTNEPKKRMALRKKILLLLGSSLLLMLSVFLILWFAFWKPKPQKLPQYHFYPITDEDIFTNDDYLSLNRLIRYSPHEGYSSEITQEDLDSDPALAFLVDYLSVVNTGDFASYPSFFSDGYQKKEKIPTFFTQQMIYDIEIRLLASNDSNPTYQLNYRIHRNNGTFRRDVDSDGIRPQYVVLQPINGEYRISEMFFQGIQTQ